MPHRCIQSWPHFREQQLVRLLCEAGRLSLNLTTNTTEHHRSNITAFQKCNFTSIGPWPKPRNAVHAVGNIGTLISARCKRCVVCARLLISARWVSICLRHGIRVALAFHAFPCHIIACRCSGVHPALKCLRWCWPRLDSHGITRMRQVIAFTNVSALLLHHDICSTSTLSALHSARFPPPSTPSLGAALLGCAYVVALSEASTISSSVQSSPYSSRAHPTRLGLRMPCSSPR
jgi:hypothetical protein